MTIVGKPSGSGMPISGSDAETDGIGNWHVSNNIRFSETDVMLWEAYGDAVDQDPPLEADCNMAGRIEDDDF